MLPVPHHACTLATGALRSSFTIKVRPSGNTHFFAVFGGKVMSIESLSGAAFRFTILKTNAEMTPATVTRYTTYCLFDPGSAAVFDHETFGAGKPGRTSIFFSGANGFTNAS